MKIHDFSHSWKDLAKGAMPQMTSPSQEAPSQGAQDEATLSRDAKASAPAKEYKGIFDMFSKKKDKTEPKPVEHPPGIFDKPASGDTSAQPSTGAAPAQPSSGAPTTMTMDGPAATSLQQQEQLSQSDLEQRLKERLKVIESLARGLGGDFRMSLREGDCWAYSFNDNTMIYSKDDLMNRHEDYCVGVVLHETGHHEYSEWNIEPQYMNEPFTFLMNAVEDPRVNNLMASRFKGAPQFFKRVYDEDLFTPDFTSKMKEKLVDKLMKEANLSRQDAEKVAQQMAGNDPPKHIQYGLGVIHDWYTNGKDDPRIHDKKVLDTLHKTAGDFRQCIGLKRDIFAKDLSPAEVHKQAQETYEIVRDKIWPEYQKLVEQDKKNLAQNLQGQQSQGQQGQQGQQGGQGQSSKPQQGQQSQGGGGSSSGSKQSGKQQQSQGSKGGGKSQGAQGSQQGQKDQQSGGADGADDKQQDGAGGADDKKDQSGGAGGADDKKAQDDKKNQQGGGAGGADKDKKPEQGQGAGGKKMSDEEAKKIADKIIDELSKEMSGMIEGKEQQAKKQGRKPGQGQQNQKNQQGQKNQDAGKGKDGKDAKDAQDGKDAKDGKDAQDGQGADKADGADGADGAQDSQGGSDGPGSTSDIDLPSLEELLKKKMELDAFVQPKNDYDRYYRDVADSVTDLTGELKNVLRENESRKFIGFYPTGKRIAMKKAMQSQAKMEVTGEYDPEIWERPVQPTKRGYKFQFVLDESGSMQDPGKWDNALRALVLGGEALNELKIDFGIVGFSDEPKIHKDFKDNLDDPYRERIISDILGSNHGGTNDADAVKVAIESIRKQSSDSQKFVVVITDGQGKEAEMKQLVKDALNEGVIVIGVGIDQAMEHVKEVYPINVLVNNINALPIALAELIKDIVEGKLDIGAVMAKD